MSSVAAFFKSLVKVPPEGNLCRKLCSKVADVLERPLWMTGGRSSTATTQESCDVDGVLVFDIEVEGALAVELIIEMQFLSVSESCLSLRDPLGASSKLQRLKPRLFLDLRLDARKM